MKTVFGYLVVILLSISTGAAFVLWNEELMDGLGQFINWLFRPGF